MTTKAENRAAVAKALYAVGTPTADGSLLVDPEAAITALVQLAELRPAKAKGPRAA